MDDSTVTQFSGESQLGPYRIEGMLGAGGMGTVYRATDTRLGRPRPESCAARYTERFRREAKAISALNHPHICTLYDVGPNYLVMELLEGSTLSDEIKDAPMAPETVARYGAQIASALVEAHAKGVVHRDLKPGNIMITRHGVKVLDFGLAKVAAEPGLTVTNVIMGTPAYMAPEQTEGREADAPADLFALGLVLYKMLTGRLPFPGASLGSMLVSRPNFIEPPCRAGTKYASRWNKLILQLLEKDPACRPQSTAGVHQELLELGRPERHWSVALAVTVGALGVAAVALWFFYRAGTRPQRWPEVSRVSMISTYLGDEATPSVSPDGMFVAFSWRGPQEGGHPDIYITRLDGEAEPRQLTHDVSEDTMNLFPAWSPDGRQVAFVQRQGATSGKIIVIPAEGGPEREIREIRFVQFPASKWLAWTPDGTQIAFASASLESGRSTLFLMRLTDGRVRSLIVPPGRDDGDASPTFSPDGTSLAFLRWSSPETSSLLVQKLGADRNPRVNPQQCGPGNKGNQFGPTIGACCLSRVSASWSGRAVPLPNRSTCPAHKSPGWRSPAAMPQVLRAWSRHSAMSRAPAFG